MTELAAARELLGTARGSFTTLRATHRLWRDSEVLKARGRYLGEARRAAKSWVASPWVSQPEDQSATEARFLVRWANLWVRLPAEIRIEHKESILVVAGDRWWELGRAIGPTTGQDAQIVKGMVELEHVAFMLDPSPFARMAGLSLAGTESVGGRATVKLKSPEPADPASLLFPGIGWACFDPELELCMDAERGILLRTVERFHGRDLQVAELVDVTFEMPISDEVFKLSVPPGQDFRRYEDVCPRRLPAEQAVDAVPFTIFVPQNVPPDAGSWDGEVIYEPGRRWLGLGFIDRNKIPQTRVDITEEAGWQVEEVDLADYERIEDDDGQTMLIRSRESEDGPWYSLLLSRSGTRISINSLLSREAAIAIARSLKPLSTH